MHLLLAPNAFKNSLTAPLAALAMERGLLRSVLNCTTECFPIGDGGDGTGDLLIDKNKGTRVETVVKDPLGRMITASYGLIDDGKTAVIEMANASGLRLLSKDELDPLTASSYGTGQQIADAVKRGVTSVIVAMGGSATVDGATGMLSALGVRFLNEHGERINAIGDFDKIKNIDLSQVDEAVLACKITVLCDVDNPLTGASGAAAMFGPQKGATVDGVKQLDKNLSHFSDIVFTTTGKKIDTLTYAGTAGGAAGGLHGLLNATLVNGAATFLSLTNFQQALEKASFVITGEGSIDEQTLQGKGPYAVAAMAKAKQVPAAAMAGRIPSTPDQKLLDYFNPLIDINESFTSLEVAMAATAINLEKAAFNLGNKLALK